MLRFIWSHETEKIGTLSKRQKILENCGLGDQQKLTRRNNIQKCLPKVIDVKLPHSQCLVLKTNFRVNPIFPF